MFAYIECTIIISCAHVGVCDFVIQKRLLPDEAIASLITQNSRHKCVHRGLVTYRRAVALNDRGAHSGTMTTSFFSMCKF